MAKNGIDIQKLLGIGSEEKTREDVRRIERLDDLDQGEEVTTELDPGKGRTTTRRQPGARFGPSGHILQGATEQILGECVSCREEFDREGEPQKLTVVPRDPGGGGICAGCQKVYCAEHASLDEHEKLWYCEDCDFDRGVDNAERAVLAWLCNSLFGGDDE